MNVKEELSKTIKDCKRVLRISKKPTSEEYISFAKVTALGIVIIGVIGFIIVLIGQLIGL
ncbi:MAG: protein translocase SEC61 complex subunit gamma [Methanobacteriaceae archaeon]|jgi:protein transport protein SEC61 subunit gamma-like protein|nr:protein translocase SEC61 complex subunit gamma [Methanobacteriaceae archaeon]